MNITRRRLLLLAGLFCVGFYLPTLAEERDAASVATEKRLPWTTSQVKGSPEPPLPYRAEPLFPHLSFHQPTVLTGVPGTERLFVVEQSGRIFSIENDRDCRQADLFLDTSQLVEKMNASLAEADQVTGLRVYGLTFHPKFQSNRRFYLCYVVQYKDKSRGQHPHGTRVVELLADRGQPPAARIESEVEVISWIAGGHNGGCLKFGPDGMLYISTGDGSTVFPPDQHTAGQDVTNLLSSVLRIDIDRKANGHAYAIPDDNPFAINPADSKIELPRGVRKEVWAYGMRNPWKMSFDRKTGELWVGDVGWELWELIYRVKPADNFGWSLVEGPQSVRPDQPPGPTPVKPPTVEIPHTEAASITGGFVYRGDRLPELQGHYIFGDWETRRFWSVAVDGDKIGPRRELVEPTVRIVGFAERNDGELLLLDYDDGSIHHLVRNEAASTEASFPRRLSETGLFDSVKSHTPADGVVPFSINASRWADHATAERWLGLPGDSAIAVHHRPSRISGSQFRRTMDYPKDAVLLKTLSLELIQGDPSSKRKVETQLLHFNGYDWRGYSYRWNDEQTDAKLVDPVGGKATFEITDPIAPGGKRRHVWRFHSRADCARCHNPWAEYSLAFNVAQLNREVDQPHRASGRLFREPGASAQRLIDGRETNQLELLYRMGVLHDAPPDAHPDDPFVVIEQPLSIDQRPKLVDPTDESADLDSRARSYLHINCAHCHRFNGGGSARIYLPFDTSIYKTEAVSTRPSQGTFGIDKAMIIAPGDPFRSVLYFRMAKMGPGHMPHLGSSLIDAPGLALVHDWILNLPPDIKLAEKVDELTRLDEPTVLEQERKEAPMARWQLARRIARWNNREIPTQADMDTALTRAQTEATEQAVERERRRTELLNDLFSDLRGAIALARARRGGKLPASISERVLTAATEHDDLAIRDLFEPFLPDDQRIERLGDSIDPQQLLELPGDVERGRDLFLNAKGVSCRNCHRIGNQGETVLGPDLSGIGKKLDRAKLLESLLEPSKTIDPKFAAWSILTDSGNIVTGLLVERTDQRVTLRDPQNKQHQIPSAEIEQLFPSRVSLMPDRQLRDLTAQQAADLLTWLESLK